MDPNLAQQQQPNPALSPGGAPSFPPAPEPPVWGIPATPVPPPVVSGYSGGSNGKRRRDPLTLVMFAAAFVAVGGVGFAAGRVTAPTPAATASRFGGNGGQFGNGGTGGTGGQFGSGGTGGAGRFGGGGLSIRGTVTEVATDHISLQLANGTTVSIPINASTAYHSQAAATAADVKTGVTVQVQLSVGGLPGGGVQNPSASGAPGQGGQGGFGRAFGPASDITIVGQ